LITIRRALELRTCRLFRPELSYRAKNLGRSFPTSAVPSLPRRPPTEVYVLSRGSVHPLYIPSISQSLLDLAGILCYITCTGTCRSKTRPGESRRWAALLPRGSTASQQKPERAFGTKEHAGRTLPKVNMRSILASAGLTCCLAITCVSPQPLGVFIQGNAARGAS